MIRRNPLRPVSFNLKRIHMPVGALISITHRVTGVAMALGIPFGFYALYLSLASAQSYEHLVQLANTGLFKAALVIFAWALSHHLLVSTIGEVIVGLAQLDGTHHSTRPLSRQIVNIGRACWVCAPAHRCGFNAALA